MSTTSAMSIQRVKPDKINGTILTRLKWLCDLDPHQEVMVSYRLDGGHSSITRAELYIAATRFAGILHHAGIVKGDVVANTLPTSLERLVTDTGILLAGAITVGLNATMATGERLFPNMRRCSCKAVIVTPDLEDTDWKLFSTGFTRESVSGVSPLKSRTNVVEGFTVQCTLQAVPSLSKAFIIKRRDGSGTQLPDIPSFLLTILQTDNSSSTITAPAFENCNICPEDTAAIYTTSGSTGSPKLFPRSHAFMLNISMVFIAVIKTFNPRPDTNGHQPTMFNNHPMGLLVGFPSVFYGICGRTVTLDYMSGPDVARDEVQAYRTYWHAIRETGPDMVHLVTPEVKGMLESDAEPKVKSPLAAIGGSAVGPDLCQNILGVICDSICHQYGSVEMGGVSVNYMTRPEDYSPGDCGLPLEGVSVRIVDNAGKILSAEQQGNIQVKSIYVVQKYLDGSDISNMITEDGWFSSGDVGYFRNNTDGHLVLVGRKDDVILYGPYNVFPSSIERIIAPCPGIQSVVVIPVSDCELNQEVCACVLREPGSIGDHLDEEGVRSYMRSQLSDPPSKYTPVPRYVLLFDEFPKTASYSKINRRELILQAHLRLGIGNLM